MPDKYKGGEDVPTGNHDPKHEFFAGSGPGLQANCYSFAVNVLNSASPDLYPGALSYPEDTKRWAYGQGPSIDDYVKACQLDHFQLIGNDMDDAMQRTAGRTDGFLVMVEKAGPMGDFHCARMDSDGHWCEKNPNIAPALSESNKPGLQGSMALKFGLKRFFWVDPNVVKLTAVTTTAGTQKTGCPCIIL
ncbi:MAG TPA: hypothetical protein VHT24_01845 [Pseudacidobacterium sp.]|jgi:hypothetical protein|nr:hypothetical protein [Pseudacidobacterium sp.]